MANNRFDRKWRSNSNFRKIIRKSWGLEGWESSQGGEKLEH